jgi:hypothetical protein
MGLDIYKYGYTLYCTYFTVLIKAQQSLLANSQIANYILPIKGVDLGTNFWRKLRGGLYY